MSDILPASAQNSLLIYNYITNIYVFMKYNIWFLMILGKPHSYFCGTF
jgi:hypothetical protein